MPRNAPESGPHAPEPSEQIKSLEQGIDASKKETADLLEAIKGADLVDQLEITEDLLKEEKKMAKLTKEADKLRAQLQREAKRHQGSASRDEEDIAELESPLVAHKERLDEIGTELGQINSKLEDPSGRSPQELKDLVDQKAALTKEKDKLEGKTDRIERRVDRRVKFGRFGKNEAKDLAQLKAQAKRKRGEAQSKLAEIAEMEALGLGDDPDLAAKKKEAEDAVKQADETLAETDEPKEQKEEKEVVTQHQKMVRITRNLAQHLSVNPPIEGEKFNGEVMKSNIADMFFRLVLSKSGEEGLQAIQELPGVEDKLRDYMGMRIYEGVDKKTGEKKLKYEFKDIYKNKEAIDELKALREGISNKTAPEQALERSAKEMRELGSQAMQGMLEKGTLAQTMVGKELTVDSNLSDFLSKALEAESESFMDQGHVKEKLEKAFANTYILDNVRESLNDLQGDELATALTGLGISKEAYASAAENELTDKELQTLLLEASFGPELPMFKGQSVGDVLQDLYKESGEDTRDKLKAEFAEDDAAQKLFKEQDKIESESGIKDMVQMVLESGPEDVAAVRAMMSEQFKKAYKANALGLKEDSAVLGSEKVLDFLFKQSNPETEVPEDADAIIQALSAANTPAVAHFIEGLNVSESDSQKIYSTMLGSLKDVPLGEVLNVPADEVIKPYKKKTEKSDPFWKVPGIVDGLGPVDSSWQFRQ